MVSIRASAVKGKPAKHTRLEGRVNSKSNNLTSSRRQTLPRYGGGFQVGRLVGSRFSASDTSLAPRRDCPPLLFDSFRAVAVSVYDQTASRAMTDPRRKRNLIPMATT